MHTIERELINATDYKTRKKFDDRQDYLKSILNAVMKLGDADFDELTDEAASWANAAVESYNSKTEIPDFDEVSEDDESEDADETVDPETGEVTEDDEAEAEDDDESEAEDDDADDDSESDEEPDEDEATSDMDETEPDPEEAADEPVDEAEEEPVKPKRKSPGSPNKKATMTVPPAEKTTYKTDKKYPKVPPQLQGDAKVDKWGCIEGSKNARALAMFEKGATAAEVKKKLGGTYYNILARCVKEGHKMHKEGSVITIIHKGAVKKAALKPPPKETKPAAAPVKKAVAKKPKK